MSESTEKYAKPPRRWLRRVLLLALALVVLNLGVNLWLRSKKWGAPIVNGFLASKLAATFGRTVHVGYFQISLLGRPGIEANSVTLAEDPRFGGEFFLIADKLSAAVRWRSLFAGRFEFGTLGLVRPSLNLVRNAAGEWNLAGWLPAPAVTAGARAAAVGEEPRGRIYRIEVDGGRVNFKQGPDKHPFSFVEVRGSVEQEAPGRWRVDLESQVLRATVAVQEAGLIRVRGRIGGTRARLRPAELGILWEDASLADVLRLAHGYDSGVRGQMSLEMTARTGAAADRAGKAEAETTSETWIFAGMARLRNVHRWDIVSRPGDPSVNVMMEAKWSPGRGRVEITRGEIQAPGSSIAAFGALDWSAGPGKQLDLQFTSSGIALADGWAWWRAFHAGVREGASLDGNGGLNVRLTGWPLRIEQGVAAVEGAQLTVPGLATPVKAARLVVSAGADGALVLAPGWLAMAGPRGEETGQPAAKPKAATPEGPRLEQRLQLEGKWAPEGNHLEIGLSGQMDRAQDWLAAASALGWTPLGGTSVEGEGTMRLRWQGRAWPLELRPAGTVELRGVRLSPPFLSEPVALAGARLSLAPEKREFEVTAAQAFGARWKGKLLSTGAGVWGFALDVDRLDVAEVARWMLPLHESTSGPLGRGKAGYTVAGPLFAGRLSIEQLRVAPMELRRVRAQAVLVAGTEWTLQLTQSQAELYGGQVSGTFQASGVGAPEYRFEGHVERISLGALTDATATLKNRFSGVASGEIKLATRGVGREALIAALEGSGSVRVSSAEVRGMDLPAALRGDGTSAAGRARVATAFTEAAGDFELVSRAIHITGLRLSAGGAEWEASGTVDFAQALDLRLRGRGSPEVNLRLTGTLAEPKIEKERSKEVRR